MEIRTGIVTGSSVVPNGDGAEPGRVLQAIITDPADVQNIQTCQAGDEYNPSNGVVVVLSAGGNAYKVALTLDDGIAPVMTPGGKRIYATDAEGAAEVAEARLHPSGLVELFNAAAGVTLAPDGTITVSNDAGGATLSPAGVWTFHGTASHFDHPVTMAETLTVATSVTAPLIAGTTDVTFAGKSAAGHTHTGGTISGSTGAPV